MISHFREPMDIASSSLCEKHAVYGGGPNLKLGLKNVISKYHAGLIGIATTCLTETIGDDVSRLVKEFAREFSDVMEAHGSPELVTVSTPSYAGTHMEGFHEAIRATVDQVARETEPHEGIAVFPGFVSPADIRYLREVLADFPVKGTVLPDISLTLDAPALKDYEKLPSGGTPVPEIIAMGGSRGALELGRSLFDRATAGDNAQHQVFCTPVPVGAACGAARDGSILRRN